jgi:hypothetical protein
LSGDYKEFWSSLPEKAEHPLRIPILEAFRWIAEPLSAIGDLRARGASIAGGDQG